MGVHLEKGKRAVEQHKYLTAQRELTVFTKSNSENIEAQGYLMLAAFYNNDHVSFSEIGRKIVNQPLDNSKLLGDLNWLANRFDEYYPSDSLKHLLESNIDSIKSLPDIVYKGYLEDHPQEVYAYFSYASSLYDQGRYGACDSVLEIVLAKDEAHIPALRMKTSAQRELGNWDASVKTADRILAINKEAAYAIASKARTRLKQHEDKEALRLALQSVDMDKEDGYSACTLVLAYHFNNQLKERDALISSIEKGGNQDMIEYLTFAQDVISKKNHSEIEINRIMFIPGIVISLVTFPGVIVHELAHQLFCRLYKVPVFKVVYFQMENPVGYVMHEPPANKWHSIMISIGPFFINTLLGALVALPASIPVFMLDKAGPLDYLLIYLGVSIAMHAFPSTGDANVIWEAVKDKHTNLLVKILGYPIVGLIYLGSLGSFFWLDLAYGVGVATGFHKLIIGLFL